MSITGKPRPKAQPWNPVIKKQLQEIADKLPKLERTRQCLQVISGELADKLGIKLKDGETVDKTKSYGIEVPDLVDHYEGLRTAYLRYGLRGVEQYKREVIGISIQGKDSKDKGPAPSPTE
jgi:hypothetical protein